jgi:hypothetical protein
MTRPLFYGLLKFPYFIETANWQHILLARGMFGFLGFINLLLIYRLIRSFDYSHWQSIGYVFFLLTFHVFFYKIYRVRSDFLVLTFLLIAIERILRGIVESHKWLKFDLVLPALVLLMCLSTPKSVYALCWLFIFYNWYQFDPQRPLTAFSRSLLMIGLPPSLLLITFQLLVSPSSPLPDLYATSLNYYLMSFNSSFESISFLAIKRSLAINFLQYLGIALGLGLFLLHKKTQSKKQQAMILFFGLALLTLILHPERWDFFIAFVLPFIGLPFLFIIQRLENRTSRMATSLALFLIPGLMTQFSGWHHSNQMQKRAIDNVSLVIGHFPGAALFDATGILPRGHRLNGFIGPNDVIGNRNTLMAVETRRPEFILYTPKVALAAPQILVFLTKEYAEKRPGLWVRKDLATAFDEMGFQQWRYHLGAPFVYDHFPKVLLFESLLH